MKPLLLSFVLLFIFVSTRAQSFYYPPVSGNVWDTISPVSLGWCPNQIDTLTQYLADKNTKAFIVLKDGKIVIENYFGTFTQDSIWYWASAGKSLSAFLVGIAQENGLLSIDDTVAAHLGSGWTDCTGTDEEKITIKNQLNMTTGFDDDVPDPDCTTDSCLTCIATPGNRWAYHNAPYHLIHDVLSVASGNSLNAYTWSNLTTQTGISGLWIDHVFYSTPRSMARFGLLTLGNGIWDSDTILHDSNYFQEMISTSQAMNPSYGYLWWLNGKGSFMAPQSQFVFQGDLVPNAPNDMIAALGKNDQKIYVVPSQNLVVIRMGNNSGNIPLFAISSFDNELWEKLNAVFCTTLSLETVPSPAVRIVPNPSNGNFKMEIDESNFTGEFIIFDATGKRVKELQVQSGTVSVSLQEPGIYTGILLKDKDSLPLRVRISIVK